VHQRLKTIWYLRDGVDSIDSQVDLKDESRFENTYNELFNVDVISDKDRYWIEIPFTFIMWKKIEML